MDKTDVAKKIAELRIRNGLTQKEIADRIGKSETTVGNYETGKIDIPLSSMLDIADALEVEPAVLVGGDQDNFGAEITIRAYREEDRRTLISILGMNGYTVRHVKIAREGKKSSWYCIQAKLEEGNVMSQ
ncbi:MAG: helix-turn-helix domain-containing protein [Blautia sp.]